MTDKDPKDMTAAELLREADSNPCSMCHLVMTGDESCATTGCASWAYRLADKIDAELAQARELSLRAGAELWAKANGWPDFSDGEDFGAWLYRCFIPRPRFEDGEPVHIGDKAEHPYTGETCTIDCINTFDDSYCLGFVDERSASLLDRERVKRPAPEALGADGLPVKSGDEVWTLSGTGPHAVDTVYTDIPTPDGRDRPWANIDNDGTWAYVESLTHTPPDTQERIDADARKDQFEYWQCRECECDECPAEIEGMSPKKRYGCNDCCSAMALDLLRRQRELDKRNGGAE